MPIAMGIAIIFKALESIIFIKKIFYTIVIPGLFIYGIFWWRSNKQNSSDKNRSLRYFGIAIVSMWVLWGSFGDSSIDGISTYEDVEDVKGAIDIGLDALNDEYKDLCDDKRNDRLKEKFGSLRNDILLIGDNCYKNDNLNTEEQMEAHGYYQIQLEKYPNLVSLNKGVISCW
jgi:hypothetical protein